LNQPATFDDMTPIVEHAVPGARARVCIIYTGGTIGMISGTADDWSRQNLRPVLLKDLLAACPGLGSHRRVELAYLSFKTPLDSANVRAKQWQSLATTIASLYDQFDGFVVLHGTDTMAFTASALSFLLADSGKPVVLTGSQLPVLHPRTDAMLNLASAVEIAGYPAFNLPLVPEVVICFHDRILRGNRATKISSSQWLGFDSPNYPVLGRIGESIQLDLGVILAKPDAPANPHPDDRLSSSIRVIHAYPALTASRLEHDLSSGELDGVVLVCYGAGTFPSSPDVIDVLRRATEGDANRPGLPIAAVTQCLEGGVDLGLYDASVGLIDAGVATGLDCTLEAMFAKMSWAIPRFGHDELRRVLQSNQRGEQTGGIHSLIFKRDGASEPVPTFRTTTTPFGSDQAHTTVTEGKLHLLDVRLSNLMPRAHITVELERSDVGRESAHCLGQLDVAAVSTGGSVSMYFSPDSFPALDGNDTVRLVLTGQGCRVTCRAAHLSLNVR